MNFREIAFCIWKSSRESECFRSPYNLELQRRETRAQKLSSMISTTKKTGISNYYFIVIIFEKVCWHLKSYSATMRVGFLIFSSRWSLYMKLFKLMQHFFQIPKESFLSLVGFTSMPFEIHFMEIDLKRHRWDEADRNSHSFAHTKCFQSVSCDINHELFNITHVSLWWLKNWLSSKI